MEDMCFLWPHIPQEELLRQRVCLILISDSTRLHKPCTMNWRNDHIVTWRLKAGIVKSEKTAIASQRFVETRFRDDQLEQSVDKQRLIKHEVSVTAGSWNTFSWQRPITKEWTLVLGVLSPIRVKPAEAEIQNPDIQFERERVPEVWGLRMD
jgi:hypothetical protein